MKKSVNIGLIGLGTVGAGSVKILNDLAVQIKDKVGVPINLKRIVTKDTSKAKGIKYDKRIVSKNVDDILNDPEIDIVVELIGGYEPARTMIINALNKGKHVVTANKAVMAKYWHEIHDTARKNNVLVYFEASVGGAIPIIQGINEGLSANKINAIYGILNGTTNYILTKMLKDKLLFSEALKGAQKKGFAEADPTMDVKGIDAAHKLVILSSLALGVEVKLSDVYCEGIDELDLNDVKYANDEFGLVVKLLGIMKRAKNGVELRVHPTLIPESHLLASVQNEFNAVYVNADAAGKTMFYGKGAGMMPAASAVVSDIIYVARHVANETAGKLPLVKHLAGKKVALAKMDDVESKYYLRFTVIDEPGVFAKIAGILGKNKVSIESCIQKKSDTKVVPLIIITHLAKEKNIKKALKNIDHLLTTRKKSILLRIEDKL
ncbi:MAG: homoserine dehydrogenase [Elusimicrobiota bacterium]